MDLLNLTEHQARTLLIHQRWDIDKLFTAALETGTFRLFAEAGVKLVDHPINHAYLLMPSSSTITCNICLDDHSTNEFTVMDCGHYFCNKCNQLLHSPP